jgi:nonsense-mediated mRNA decay protein 3
MESTMGQDQGLVTILCCLCGAPITANPSNMCVHCLRAQVDLSQGIPKQCSLVYCKFCGRYLLPPKTWVAAELESKELMAICLKRLKRLAKLHLVDASFVWTEPHARRVRLRLTVQQEVLNRTVLQQSFVVEFVVELQQCFDCQREAAKIEAWEAVVQLRQRVDHKRTLFYLEQLILKHSAHEDVLGIRQQRDGLDFYFIHRSHALKFLSFLNGVACVRQRQSNHLVSHDPNNNLYRYKYTYSAEIAPLCREDLVYLPPKVSTQLGGLSSLVLVQRITNWILLLDPLTGLEQSLDGNTYWRLGLTALLNSRRLTEYIVLDLEPVERDPALEQQGNLEHRFRLADATIARSADLGVNDQQFVVRTHLGHLFKPGDLVLGYDLVSANLSEAVFSESETKETQKSTLPDVVLVKRGYMKKDRSKHRLWTLRELPKQLNNSEEHSTRSNRDRDKLDAKLERDREEFMQELEQDPELRATVNLYRDPSKFIEDDLQRLQIRYPGDRKWTASEKAQGQSRRNLEAATRLEKATDGNAFTVLESMDGAEEEFDDYPQVSVEELLDDLVLSDDTEEPSASVCIPENHIDNP